MDTVTQITLGAAVGEAAAGREAGNKAPLWGAAFGLLPDLDVIGSVFLTEAQALTFHRSLTHSLLFILVVTPLAAYGLRRLHGESPPSMARWAGLVGMALLTHVGLDCLTTYGTQIFWPFSTYPVILGTIFVIDPLYTLPLAIGLLVSLRWSPTAKARRWANYAGLAVSSAYLLLTMVHKRHVNRVFAQNLDRKHPATERLLTMPTPFNNLLWRGIAATPTGFYVGYYSLLDPDRSIDFRFVPKRHDLLGDATDHSIVQRLRRFSRGYFVVRRGDDGGLKILDLRFGRNDLGLTSSGQYLFTFRLLEGPKGRIVGMRQDEPPIRLNGALLRRFVARIQGRPPDSPAGAHAKTP
ncbi:MAG: metal-dependent hydrolase [Salinibacter sp.]